MLALTCALALASPPTLMRVDDPGEVPAGAEHLGGPFYRVTRESPRALRALSGVRWAVAEARRRVRLDQLEPAESLQWHLANDGSRTDLWPRIEAGADVNVASAWASSLGAGVTIAVLDTGFPLDHPDLPASQQLSGWDFVDQDADPSPVGHDSLAAHGIAVAALALAPRNGVGIVGVCPGCSLLPVRVLAPDSTLRDGDLVAALLWAAERADIVNASWSFDVKTFVPPAIVEAMRWAATHGRGGRGCVMVFSAGNRASSIEPFAPESMVETIAVGATDERDLRAGYSNTGPYLSLMAPGGLVDQWSDGARIPRAKLITADLEGDAGNSPNQDARHAPGIVDDPAITATFRGTSAAAPLVAGAAGLVLAVAPELTSVQVTWVLTESAARVGGQAYIDGRNDSYGHGRLDVGAAVSLASSDGVCVVALEVCDNGVDDDCDRAVDEDDPDCGAERPRPYELPWLACDEGDECGDGFCAPPDGVSAARLCTAECDYDCPSDSLCVGPESNGLCVPTCTTSDDCLEGFSCVTPEAELLPPGVEPAPACLPACQSTTDCRAAFCFDGACSAASPPSIEEPPEEGCECSSAHAVPVALLLLLRRRARRLSGRRPRSA